MIEKKTTDKLDFIQVKTFHAANGAIKKAKRQLTDWEERFANHVSEKGFESRIYENI